MNGSLAMDSVMYTVGKSWLAAEAELRRLIETKHHDLDEELVTRLFYGELRFALAGASKAGAIAWALREDLRLHLCSSDYELDRISEGLIAEVTLHPRHLEKITTADFGLTIARPTITICGGDTILIDPDENQQGLICQAKVRRRDLKWGRLTSNQRSWLPERRSYTSLVLYEYDDPDRRLLREFSWQLCRGASPDDVKAWLKNGSFPAPIGSADVITQLAAGRIGTEDKDIITSLITPDTRPSMQIRIYWPKWKDPGAATSVHLQRSAEQKDVALQHVWLTNAI